MKLLVRVRSYLKYLLRKEGRKYLDNKLKMSSSKVILVVTLVCQTSLLRVSHTSCHLVIHVGCLSSILSRVFPHPASDILLASRFLCDTGVSSERPAKNNKYERSLILIVLYALVCRLWASEVHLSGKMPSVEATPAPVPAHIYA